MNAKIKLVQEFVPPHHGCGGKTGMVLWGWEVVTEEGARLGQTYTSIRQALARKRLFDAVGETTVGAMDMALALARAGVKEEEIPRLDFYEIQ